MAEIILKYAKEECPEYDNCKSAKLEKCGVISHMTESSANCIVWGKVNRVMNLIGVLEFYLKYEEKPAKLRTQIKLTGAEIIELENRGYSVKITKINKEKTLTIISKK